MPCTDGGPSAEQVFEARAMPAVLCAVFTELDRTGELAALLSMCDWTEAGVTGEWVRLWWENHKAQDARRRDYERQVAARARLRAEAIGRLTPEERDALGVRP